MNKNVGQSEEISEKRKNWLLKCFLNKLVAKGCKPNLRGCLKRAFEKFDRDGSGELDAEEFRLAMKDILPGIDENEFVALARSFDQDGNELISINEFVHILTNLAQEDSVFDTGKTPGAHTQSVQQEIQRHPEICGTEHKRTGEFFDDGYNRDPKEEFSQIFDPQLGAFFLELKRRAEAKLMSYDVHNNDATYSLIQRSFERQKSTEKSQFLNRIQFQRALDCFDDAHYTALIDIETLYKKCHNGNFAYFMKLFQHYAVKNMADENEEDHTQVLTKKQKSILQLKYQLLDKINERSISFSSNFRVRLKRIVGKFDLDLSGELETNEIQKAFSQLLPGVHQEQIHALVQDLDADGNGALSVDEVADSLLKLQVKRNPTNTSLKLARKKPLTYKIWRAWSFVVDLNRFFFIRKVLKQEQFSTLL